MTKSELITKIAEESDALSKRQVEFIVNNVFTIIKDALKADDKVELRGFGSFKVRYKAAKSGRNPKTGEKVDVAETKVPYFRPGREIKEELLRKE